MTKLIDTWRRLSYKVFFKPQNKNIGFSAFFNVYGKNAVFNMWDMEEGVLCLK